ncbi:unnamed protein product [Pseudo-nitzschia multistriata]|uniref:Uncharacterized protein n=1 Tax=Pseudo-nitzschia multistriata TaxID=183589 RepID=A0A448Z4X7_9STRA|nr:unnamed protein product [Pseudo-nitzschia multistriata]
MSSLTLNAVEYDFEDYVLQHGIPETLDPLPYRKAGSVFSNAVENDDPNNSNANETGGASNSDLQSGNLTSAKHDPRLRTVVCLFVDTENGAKFLIVHFGT